MGIVYLIPEALFSSKRKNICKKGRHEIQLNICERNWKEKLINIYIILREKKQKKTITYW